MSSLKQHCHTNNSVHCSDEQMKSLRIIHIDDAVNARSNSAKRHDFVDSRKNYTPLPYSSKSTQYFPFGTTT